MNDLKRVLSMLETQDKKILNIEKTLKLLLKENRTPKRNKKQETNNKHTGLTGTILELTKTSFFDTPKEFKEIKGQLEANAIFYPRTNYPKSLLRLVKQKKLRRLKDNNKWKYVNYG